MGHHHLPALPPVNIPVVSRTEPLRWRPRIGFRRGGPDQSEGPEAAKEGDDVYAIEAAQEDGTRKRRARREGVAMPPPPRQVGIAALSDATLGCLLVGQEAALDKLT
jgi:hypothetical protein